MGVTRVVVSSSSWRDYNFLLPATALLWRERIGFEPILFLTGPWLGSRRAEVSMRALQGFGFEYLTLPEQPGVSEATLAQNSRQVAAALPFPDDMWLCPSDADLWPIRKDYYYQHENQNGATALYANGDHYASYPTCHLIMKARVWRSAYSDVLAAGDPAVSAARALEEWKSWSPLFAAATDKNLAIWCSDQWQMTERVRRAGVHVTHIERAGHPPADRIDRGVWPGEGYAIRDYVDAHMPKAPEEPANWGKTRALFAQLLPQKAKWFEDYRERYVAATGGS